MEKKQLKGGFNPHTPGDAETISMFSSARQLPSVNE